MLINALKEMLERVRGEVKVCCWIGLRVWQILFYLLKEKYYKRRKRCWEVWIQREA